MKCCDANQHIVACIDGELNPQDQQALFHHLASCDSCSEYYDSMGQIDSMLKDSLILVEAPQDFTRQLMLRLESEKDYCAAGEELEEPKVAQEKSRRRWLPSLSNGWLKTGIAASIAMMLLFGGLGLSGNAYMDESFAKRMVLISRDGISGIRRVVDNVIHLAQNDGENKPDSKKPDAKNPDVPKDAEAEKIPADLPGEELLPVEEPDAEEGGFDIALQQEDSSKPPEAEADESGEGHDSDLNNSVPQVSMTAIVSPLIVTQGIDNLRPVWVDNDTVFYLSEKGSPGDGFFGIWETDSRGSTRRMVSVPGYWVGLEQGGGVWSTYFQNYAFVTNQNGYWQLAYGSLKGEYRMAVEDNGSSATPAPGALLEYNPVPSANGELAFLTKRFGNVDLMAVDHKGSLRVLTQSPEIESNPAWSPDGARIAFVSTSANSQNSRVMVADKNGKGATAVTPSISNAKMVPVWADNGQQIAVNVGKAGDQNGLWLVNSDGSNWRKITGKGGGKVVAWSPNGRMIAFTDANSRLYVWDVTRGPDNPEAIINIEPADQEGTVDYVAWSPDSKQLLLEWYGSQTKTQAIWRAKIISFK